MASRLTTPEMQKKIGLLQQLENQGVIRELDPIPTSDYRGVAYWHYEVIKPDRIPEFLKQEYKRLGELRW